MKDLSNKIGRIVAQEPTPIDKSHKYYGWNLAKAVEDMERRLAELEAKLKEKEDETK